MSHSSLLRDAAIKPATLHKYRTAVHAFITECIRSGERPCSAIELDIVLADYIDSLYAAGSSLALAKETFYGLLFFCPIMKYSMPESDVRLRGWSRLHPPVSRPPLTWEITVVMAVTMAKSGYGEYGLATLLAFDAYLRISEFTCLAIVDVALPDDSRLGACTGGHMALRLPLTKTGRNQYVTVRHPAVITLMSAWLSHRRLQVPAQSSANIPSARVFPFSAASYRSVFRSTCEVLGLGPIGYSPHSLRHGGATHDFLSGKQLQDILFRGRWAASKSAETYVQSGRALLLTASVPSVVATIGRGLVGAHDLERVMLMLMKLRSPLYGHPLS
jgi:hypothetical protein